MKKILLVGSLLCALGSPGKVTADDTRNLCTLPEIVELNGVQCSAERVRYKAGTTFKRGSIVTIETEITCQDDVCMNGFLFRLLTDEGKLVPLAYHPDREIGLGCMLSSLKLEYDSMVPQERVRIDMQTFVEQTMELLESGSIQYTYIAEYPFKGKVISAAENDCRGEFGYDENVISWPEVKALCTDAFKRDFREDFSTLYVDGEVAKDLGGVHYICNATANGYRYVYWVNMNKLEKPLPVLVRKSKRDLSRE